MHYTTDQIVRSHSSKGIFRVKGFHLDFLEVRECNEDGVEFPYETEYWHPDQVELFEFECNVGRYCIGDEVRGPGLQGKWIAEKFYESADQELCVQLRNGDVVFGILAQLCKKV